MLSFLCFVSCETTQGRKDCSRSFVSFLARRPKDERIPFVRSALVRRITKRESWTIKLDSLVESEEELDHVEAKVSSTGDTDGEEKQKEKSLETRTTTNTKTIDEQYVAGDWNTSAIGDTTVDDDDDDIPHAIPVLLTDNKNDEDEFIENNDDDSRHAAAVLLTDNMDDEYELKEKRRNRREEYSYWRKDRESSDFRQPTRE